MNCRWCNFYAIPMQNIHFYVISFKTSAFLLSHAKHPLLCYPMQNIQTPKPMYQCYLPNSESSLRESVKQNIKKAIQYVVFICERFFL